MSSTSSAPSSSSLPPNMQEFNEITAVVLSKLYISHPMPLTIDPADVAKVLGVSPTATLPSERTFNDVYGHTLAWLVRERYVYSHSTNPHDRNVLTDKALAAMNVVPPALNHSRGSELVAVSTQASTQSGKSKINDLVGSIIEGVTKGVLGSF